METHILTYFWFTFIKRSREIQVILLRLVEVSSENRNAKSAIESSTGLCAGQGIFSVFLIPRPWLGVSVRGPHIAQSNYSVA